MGAKKRGRKIRMKNKQMDRAIKKLMEQSKQFQRWAEIECLVRGHDIRELLSGLVCLRCGKTSGDWIKIGDDSGLTDY